MKKSVELLITPFKGYDFVIWDKKPLFNNHSRIISYVSANLGDEYGALFSVPMIKISEKGKEVRWMSKELGDNPVSLSVLQGDEKERYSSLLNNRLKHIREFIGELKEDSATKLWADMLQKSIKYGGEEFIFVGNENVCITGWGVEAFNEDLRPEFIPVEKTDVPENVEHGNNFHNENDDYLSNDTHLDDEKGEINNLDDFDENHPEMDDLKADNLKEKGQYQEDNQEDNALDTDYSSGNYIGNNKKPWYIKLGRYWWILLLLILVILFLLRRCSDVPTLDVDKPKIDLPNPETDNPDSDLIDAPLPDNSREIVPPELDKIGSDPDSIVQIVVDRLNVVLKGKNKSIGAFAKKFKEVYPDASYSIIYYDTLTTRLQIQLPSEKREEVKKDLPLMLPDFDMLIWSEEIFNHNTMPSDPGFLDKSKTWLFDAIKIDKAWNQSFGNQNVLVAIIDNGFDLSHPELQENIKKPYNVVSRTKNVFTNHQASHGTHVAGTAIGAMNNKIGICGIAPKCSFMPIQVADRNGIMTSTAIIDAILYAIQQEADVINLSLGMQINPMVQFYPPEIQLDMIENNFIDQEEFWESIFLMAQESNTTIVLAGGNDDVMVGLDPMQRSDKTIKVSAIDNNYGKAQFSNYGKYSTVSAPGVLIYSSIPDGKFDYKQGTSMAAPIVTGAVALLKSIDSSLNTKQIIKILVSTGIHIASSQPIGNLIQLDKAVDMLKNGDYKDDLCDDVKNKVDSLQTEIDRLLNKCPDLIHQKDTMKMPEIIDDLSFLEGRWKSTTDLNSTSGEKIVLYFDLHKNGKGKLTLVENDNTQCIGDLNLSANAKELEMNQISDANCGNNKAYRPYFFICKSDSKGHAQCVAQNKNIKANRVSFKLIRVK